MNIGREMSGLRLSGYLIELNWSTVLSISVNRALLKYLSRASRLVLGLVALLVHDGSCVCIYLNSNSTCGSVKPGISSRHVRTENVGPRVLDTPGPDPPVVLAPGADPEAGVVEVVEAVEG